MGGGRKSSKTLRKSLKFYRVHFGLISPFKVVCDGTMIHHALQNQIFLKDELPKSLGSVSKIVVTHCIAAELHGLDSPITKPAARFAKRAEKVECTHESKLSAEDCILHFVQSKGAQSRGGVLVATHDEQLILQLKKLPNAAIIVLENGKLELLEPSSSARDEAERREKVKLSVSEQEQKVLKPLLEDAAAELRKQKGEEMKKRRKEMKKKAKGPNPLSVKKKVKHSEVKVDEHGIEKSSKRKRHKKKSRSSSS
uniref:UTP23 sensor motif region domain-containing protein n=1 Tax=Timspurckia oligopyrenoides TaxID=708627 RepID=A0A7S0ZGA7_9RHOD|mmetsp:Transcript_4110/g.7221  ORF Transcript_4110/g.7221 Transcript_4110/m.7221 type:complete len:254 (+) Transcript_4110:40-801(+)